MSGALNFVYTSGEANPFRLDAQDRRFFIVKAPEVDLYRACALCRHQLVRGDVRSCGNPDLLYRGAALAIERARATGGGCGPEALRADAPWARP